MTTRSTRATSRGGASFEACELATPLGALSLAASDAFGLALVRFGVDRAPLEAFARTMGDTLVFVAAPRPGSALAEGAAQLGAHLSGAPRRARFDLALDGRGLTPFAARVRGALLAVPFGELVSYGELARRVGSVPRAIGGAMRSNRLPIVVPCHRVVGAGGALGGYTPSLDHKRALLALEGHRTPA